MRNLKKTYGAMRDVEDKIRGQVNVSGRQSPMSLKEMIGLTAGIVHGGPMGWAAALLPIVDKAYNSPTSLLNRAVSAAKPPTEAQKAVQKGLETVGGVSKAGLAVVGEGLAQKRDQGSIQP
jgi:hypothetical protein